MDEEEEELVLVFRAGKSVRRFNETFNSCKRGADHMVEGILFILF